MKNVHLTMEEINKLNVMNADQFASIKKDSSKGQFGEVTSVNVMVKN